jgi:hypothetical protein
MRPIVPDVLALLCLRRHASPGLRRADRLPPGEVTQACLAAGAQAMRCHDPATTRLTPEGQLSDVR